MKVMLLSSHLRGIAEDLLAEMPQRLEHVKQVARRAGLIEHVLDDSDTLESAAWAHDLGYSSKIASTGFHPLDGARYLRSMCAPPRLAGLVAFHSSAESEASVLGLSSELSDFEDERTITRDLLWYLDMTTGPDGTLVTFDNRMAEVRERYPVDHYVVRALNLGMAQRKAAVERGEAWLTSVGLADQVK